MKQIENIIGEKNVTAANFGKMANLNEYVLELGPN